MTGQGPTASAEERAELLRRIDAAVAAGRMSEPDRQIRVAHVENARSAAELDLLRRDLDRLLGVPASTSTPLGRGTGSAMLGLRSSLGPRLRTRSTAGRWGWTVLTLAAVLVIGVSITLTFLSMRAVMDIGGACASGGPYVSARECPSGAWVIGAAVPVLIVMSMIGSAFAVRVGAPNPLIVMWGALFGALGWNFVDYGRGAEPGLLLVGGVFWLMALPAVVVLIGWAVYRVRAAPGHRVRAAVVVLAWILGYAAVGAVAVQVGAGLWARLS